MTRFTGFLLVGLAACQPAALNQLDEARDTWEARGVADYTWVVQRGCFCPDADPVEVAVIDGVIERATRLAEDGDVELQPGEFEDWMTVDGLFAEAERAATDAASVELSFAEEGYPTVVDVDWMRFAVDDEVYYSAGELTPLDVD